ncbi:MAG: hypothetical protein JSS78_07305, partial [Bacteroidetes bacterium]|nr:hypothetical protein [Bacteroidota bacterium]
MKQLIIPKVLRKAVAITGILATTTSLASAQVSVNPGSGSYTTLAAAFTAINNGVHTGAITISITNNTSEPNGGAILNYSGNGSANYTSINISPSGGSFTISGAATAGSPLIDLVGADNVTFNGLNTGGNALSISNTTASNTSNTSTIRFKDGATGNTITNCTVLGSFNAAVTTNGGNIFFSTDGLTTSGNDNNAVTFCNIGPAGSNLPTKGIYGNGSTTNVAINNSSINISNNNIFDYFGAAVSSAGVYVSAGNIDWTISNNKFYQSATRTQTTSSQHSAVWIANTTGNSSGNNFLISGNTIGYANSASTGTYTLTTISGTKFIPIYLSVPSTPTATGVQGNTITAIAMSGATSGTGSSSPFMGVYVAGGLVTIGDVTGNTFGSQTATGVISFTTTSSSASDVAAIYNFGSAAFTANNNNIGGFTVANTNATPAAANFYGIRVNTSISVNTIVQNNTIGGTVANSIQSTSTASGTTVQGILATSSNFTATGNTIRNMTAAGGTGTTTSASVIGMSFTSTSVNHTVTQNTIHSLSNTNASAATVVTGIQFTSSTGTNAISKNFIHSFNVASGTGTINGIQVSGGTGTHSNNMIRLGIDATGANITTGAAIYGIRETSATDNFWYNSVYIGGNNVGGSAATYAFNSSVTSSSRSYRNNAFVNARSNGAGIGKHYGYAVGGTGVNPTGLTSNNNCIFVSGTGGVFGFYAATDISSGLAWQSATGQDVLSPSANPQFLNPTGTAATVNLHVSTVVATPLESSGAVVGVTDDFDNDPRSATTPDIGADEFNGITMDLLPPNITFTPLSNTSSTGTVTQAATISDVSGVPTSGAGMPTLWYRVNGGSFSSVTGTLQSGTTTLGTWAFGIPGQSVNSLVEYYIGAQDINSNIITSPTGGSGINPPGATPPGTFKSYYIVSSLSGNVKIGGDGTGPSIGNTYVSLSEALADVNPNQIKSIYVNSGGSGYSSAPTVVFTGGGGTGATATSVVVSGAVTAIKVTNIGSGYTSAPTISFTGGSGSGATATANLSTGFALGAATSFILTSSYNVNYEYKFPIVVPMIGGASASNTLTIKPDVGVTPTISGSVSDAILKLNGANYVILDGSNNGTSSRDLTISNTNSGSSAAIAITSLGLGQGATNNVVKNCVLSTYASAIPGYGISMSGSTLGSIGSDNDNNTIQNNIITGGTVGIYASGSASVSAGGLDNLSVIGNNVTINTTSSTAYGIEVAYGLTSSIAQNTISVTTSASNQPVGISVETGFVSSSITRNMITKVVTTNTGGYGGRGLTVGTGTASSALTIANNVIYGVNGSNYSGFTNSSAMGIGIGMVGSSSTFSTIAGGINLYYNSINMYGAHSYASGTNTTALYVGSAASGLDIRNNAFVNSLYNSGNSGSIDYAIYSDAAGSAFATINNNDYFGAPQGGSNSAFYVGYLGSAQQTLANWQSTVVSPKDANSISLNPAFNGDINLTPQPGSPLLGAGTVVSITTDFNGSTRSLTNPTIGAYEGSLDLIGPAITYTALGNTTSTLNQTFTATINDASGVATGANQPLIYYRKGNSGAFYSAAATNVTGNNYTFTIDYTNVTGGSVTTLDVIQYYVAAQDIPGNLSTSPTGGSGTNPPGTTAPISPNQYTINAQYTWQGTTNDFTVSSNWSPARNTPNSFDELIFDGSVTSTATISNIPTQSIGKLRFINNVNASLDAATANNTLTMSGATVDVSLQIGAGSTVSLGSTNALSLGFSGSPQATIAGTLNLNTASGLNTTNSSTTVSASGIMAMNGTASITSTTSTLTFAANSNLTTSQTTLTIPTATFGLNAMTTVTGVTSATSGTVPSSIGGLTWNCNSQTATFSFLSVVTSINGDLNIVNTGTGSFQTGTTTTTNVAIAGNTTITGGTCNISGNSWTINGLLSQSGGTLVKTVTSATSYSANGIAQTSGTINMNNTTGLFTLTASSGNMILAGTVNGGTTGGGMALNFTGTGSQLFDVTGGNISNLVSLSVNKSSGLVNLGSDFTLNSGASLTLQSGTLNLNSKNLTINGTVNGIGIVRGSSTSNLTIGGTGAMGTLLFDQTIDGSTNVLNNLTVSRTTSGSATLGNKAILLSTLTLSNGTLNTGGNLVLRSTSVANTAVVAPVTGTGAISGNVTVERFIPLGKRAYRQLASGVTTTSNILTNWQNNGNNAAGNGIFITGSTSGTNGFDASTSGLPNMFGYTPGSLNFTAITNTNTNTLNSLRGYRVFVYGDRNANLSLSNLSAGIGSPNIAMNSATTIRTTGTLNIGNVTFTNTGTTTTSGTDNTVMLGSNVNDFALIANPYWNSVNWDNLTNSNLSTTYWIWDPNVGNRGGYVSYITGAGNNNIGSAMNQHIQPGQAIFVQTSAANPSLTFNESNKSGTFTNTFRLANQTPSKVYVSLYENTALANNGSNQDCALGAFRDDFTNGVTQGATKFANPDENIALVRNSNNWSTDARHTVTVADTLPMRIWNLYSNNSYTLKLDAMDFDLGISASLIDKKNNQSYPVNL